MAIRAKTGGKLSKEIIANYYLEVSLALEKRLLQPEEVNALQLPSASELTEAKEVMMAEEEPMFAEQEGEVTFTKQGTQYTISFEAKNEEVANKVYRSG